MTSTIPIVAEIGETVRLALGVDVDAIVTGISIGEKGVLYELTWMSGGEVKQAWLPGIAIKRDREPRTIGFSRAT